MLNPIAPSQKREFSLYLPFRLLLQIRSGLFDAKTVYKNGLAIKIIYSAGASAYNSNLHYETIKIYNFILFNACFTPCNGNSQDLPYKYFRIK